MMQYSRFIKNGWTILPTNHPNTSLAAASPKHCKQQEVVLVVSNFDGGGEYVWRLATTVSALRSDWL